MATAVREIEELECIGIGDGPGFWLEETASPLGEAVDLFESVWRENLSVESVRELIAVPKNIEAALRQYARRYPEDAPGIERVLKFRRQVGEEFESLLRDRDAWSAAKCVGSIDLVSLSAEAVR